ncbi:hypothetical protein B9Z55_020575 [Caenorhabditis nigoni]|uniref:Uncharacterized protein n=1 Tax=Caenorhabditis nigoni TaxID=1611254 RepID=A0A2G5TP56_9PELO|nr:hypothetical protein B9Z55_020575 [Caenorhabditis nigoni]
MFYGAARRSGCRSFEDLEDRTVSVINRIGIQTTGVAKVPGAAWCSGCRQSTKTSRAAYMAISRMGKIGNRDDKSGENKDVRQARRPRWCRKDFRNFDANSMRFRMSRDKWSGIGDNHQDSAPSLELRELSFLSFLLFLSAFSGFRCFVISSGPFFGVSRVRCLRCNILGGVLAFVVVLLVFSGSPSVSMAVILWFLVLLVVSRIRSLTFRKFILGENLRKRKL